MLSRSLALCLMVSAQAPVAAPVEAAVEEAAAVTCRSGTVRLAVEEPLFDAETGEELSTITSTSLFDEDVLRALQPPPPATERSADSSKQEKQRMVLGGTMRLKGTMRSRGGGAGLLTATQRLSPMQEPSTADGQSLAEDSRALPSVMYVVSPSTRHLSAPVAALSDRCSVCEQLGVAPGLVVGRGGGE